MPELSFFASPDAAKAAKATYEAQYKRQLTENFAAAAPNETCTYLKTKVSPFVGGDGPPCGQTDPNDLDSYIDWAAQGEDGVALIGSTAGVVGIHNKSDGATCNGSSESIGDNIGSVNGQPSTVVDMNDIAQAVGLPVNGPGGQLEQQTITVGWVYKDNRGGYWIQEDLATQNSWSVSISAYFLSAGLGSTATSVPHYVGTSPPTPKTNEAYQKCFQTGAQFA